MRNTSNHAGCPLIGQWLFLLPVGLTDGGLIHKRLVPADLCFYVSRSPRLSLRTTCRTSTVRRSTCWGPRWRCRGRGRLAPSPPAPPCPVPKPTAWRRTWAACSWDRLQVRSTSCRRLERVLSFVFESEAADEPRGRLSTWRRRR